MIMRIFIFTFIHTYMEMLSQFRLQQDLWCGLCLSTDTHFRCPWWSRDRCPASARSLKGPLINLIWCYHRHDTGC